LLIVKAISLNTLKEGFLHLFYPNLCEGCNKPLVGNEFVLCIGCAGLLPETGYHKFEENETALRFAGRVPFQRATSLAFFTDDGLLQHLLHGLKYRNRQAIGTYLGDRFCTAPGAKDWLSGIDMVIPVPLHPAKEAARGYNQSEVIASAFYRHAGIPVRTDILVRVRHTESQTKKSRAERAENMKDAFSVRNVDEMNGKHILIIDDVLTTGATIEACALALLAAGNVKISIATIGIAVS
jgi:ComF family protein